MNYSIIMYRDAFECSEAFDSILTNNCFSDTQLIIISPFAEEEDTLKKKTADRSNILLIEKEGISLADAYNLGLENAKGRFINFTLASSYLSPNALDTLKPSLNALKENGEAVKLFTVNAKGFKNTVTEDGEEKRSYFGYKMKSDKAGLNNIRIQTKCLNLLLQSYFIDSELAKSIKFNPQLNAVCENDYLLSLLEKETDVFKVLGITYYYSTPLENSPLTCENAKLKEWYTPAVRDCFIPMAKELQKKYGTVPTYLQISLLYFVWARYNCNFFERDKGTLTREEAFEFDGYVCELMQYINDNVIFQNIPCKYKMARSLKMHYYIGKCKALNIKPLEVKVINDGRYKNQLVLNSESYKALTSEDLERAKERFDILSLCTLGLTYNQRATVKVIDFIAKKIEIDVEFPMYLLDTTDYEIFAKIGDEKIEMTETRLYSSEKFFGITINRRRTFHISIPVDDMLNKSLVFGFTVDGMDYPVKYAFARAASKISYSNAAYTKLNNKRILAFRKKTLTVKKLNPIKRIGLEGKFFVYRLLRTKAPLKTRVLYLALRLIYWLVYPFMHKKHIWITFDKLYKAGDNGEYIFQYCRKLNDGIDIYYIISPDSLDYERLKKQHGKYILKQGSPRLKLLALYSEVILATHSTVFNYLGFSGRGQVFVKDLFKGIVVCIQHGLTIQKIAQYQNRIFDDTRLYTLASKYEKENCEKPPYDFFGKELKLTGLARYDGLRSNDQKQILITPTWRRNIVNQSIAFVKKSHNDSFKNSEYFRLYNNLINDEKLIECAKKTGYEIIYLLHPAMSSQAEDFDKNDYVKIMQATGEMSYEKILTESSLMVTDYSGVQFDFAYQRKPIVYYHPDTLPPQYEEGGMIYETMGFGPICKNHDVLINTLCNYMENECKAEQMYVERANDFFCFDDFNNCERIYNEVIAFMNDKSNF
ncbi:MAG: CDP-glycerol glycerophosphotransferase family protein [Oscillospiraceae bacterium]|nr:CDP-glycerol glycerophosphotransferase family protein [Oscillospiraceae bacterium]